MSSYSFNHVKTKKSTIYHPVVTCILYHKAFNLINDKIFGISFMASYYILDNILYIQISLDECDINCYITRIVLFRVGSERRWIQLLNTF